MRPVAIRTRASASSGARRARKAGRSGGGAAMGVAGCFGGLGIGRGKFYCATGEGGVEGTVFELINNMLIIVFRYAILCFKGERDVQPLPERISPVEARPPTGDRIECTCGSVHSGTAC